MANRVPLIINTNANQIQELAVGDHLDLTGSGISNAGIITATKFVGDGSLLTNIGGGAAALSNVVDDITPQLGGNLDINNNIINGSGTISISGNIQATSFTGPLIGNVTGNVLGNADTATTATTATNASGLTGSPSIQVSSIVVSGNILADTVSVASTLTYEDVTNIDSVGVVTARTGIKVLANGIDAVGVVTATSFSGDGSGLTNLPSDVVNDTTPQLGGNLDLNSKDITGTGNIDITGNLDVDGTSTFGANGSITSGANFILSGNKFRVTGTDTVGLEVQRDGNATIQCTDTTNSTDLQLRANATGGLVRTAAAFPLIFGTSQEERLRIHESSGSILVNNGNAETNATLVLSKADAGFAKLEFDVGTSQKAYIELDASENLVHYGAAGVQQLFYTGGITALTLDASQNATFSGSVTSNGITQYLLPTMGNGGQLGYDDSTKSLRLYANSSTGSNAKIQFHFNQSGTAAITFNQDSSASFGGSVSDSKGELRNLPQNLQSGYYAWTAEDAGKHIYVTGNVGLGFNGVHQLGDMITYYNASGSTITSMGIGAYVTFIDSANGNTYDNNNQGSFSFAANAFVTFLMVKNDATDKQYVMSGTGLP